ncbi:tripartite tricarboxylate transporter TctB family protein [Octadecabacter ascidiaceicola]|uniref:Tripartite tricarboxylate transporter TctB family protein n=1 Tax=Octadecabacter ascidiaceicola TaxID=1655543 RepID=A0A238JMM6_9RHOB|nr:tripartite tricarboxylate transporter TctB family protein [Octadecabacter ascidiaceicola]SMX31464.1 Tripartite tricarboxylate transporter TctB family protein [Octadecabacter ascidiaceicola]
MNDLPRTQHIFASGAIAAVGVSVAYISFTQEPADAFVFPRLIATVFAILAIWTFVKAVLGRTKVGQGLSGQDMRNLLPGLIVTLIYAFWAAKELGFYTATAIAFFILLTVYDPAPHTEAKTWVKRVLITAGFIAVMYGLFAMLLNVYTPREIFS